ncbi:MAG: acyl-CoA dehydrogenase, partial [Pseudonocardiales bacterium]|nr:acyl-CoA dehydrogenase [Pseudonocardiales bacterium]
SCTWCWSGGRNTCLVCSSVTTGTRAGSGGMGMTMDLPLEHWFRGLRVARVVEGPSEIHRFLIARDLLGGAALGRVS